MGPPAVASFLAEARVPSPRFVYGDGGVPSHAPRVAVFRGNAWARLLDDFVVTVVQPALEPGDWIAHPFTHELAGQVLTEQAAVPAAFLPPSTCCAALHRATRRDAAEVWFDQHRLLETESAFLDAVGRLPGGLGAALATVQSTSGGVLRAWPVCLRSAAVRHVQERVRAGALVPRTARVLAAWGRAPAPGASREDVVNALADWLVVAAGEEGNPERLHAARRRVAATLVADDAPQTPAVCDDDALEHDEDRLAEWASARYGGPPNPSDWDRLRHHLDRLARLVVEASRHGRDHWTEAQRERYGVQPDATLQAIAQDELLQDADGYLAGQATRLGVLVRDPLREARGAEAVTGDSQLRPACLYPS